MVKLKKGDPTDVLTFIVVIFFIAVSFTVVLFVNSLLSDVISTTALNDSSSASDIVAGFDKINTQGVQNGFLIMFALLTVGVIFSSFLVRVHPVFIIIYIISLVFSLLLSVYLSNVYNHIIENASFITVASYTPAMTWVLQHIVGVALGIGVISMIVVFGKIVSPDSAGGFDI